MKHSISTRTPAASVARTMTASVLAIACATLAAATSAHAQVSQDAQDTPEPVASTEIVVTGSRLGSGFEAPTPVTTIGEQQIEDRVFGAVA
ncbi:MAG: hypothetical protein AB7U35_10565, partial [Sphingobium sp.]